MNLEFDEQKIAPLYFIKQIYRDKVIIDKSILDGVKIRSVDDYLLNFASAKKLIYEYMKKTQQPVKISYLHKLFGNQERLDWHASKLIESDEIAKICVKKLIQDSYTWKYGQNLVHSTIFDAKYLLIKDYRLIAKECVDVYMTSQPTHYVSHKLGLRRFTDASKNNEYFMKRLEITKKFYETTILKGVELSNTLHVNYMFDCIEIYDEVTKMTFAYFLRQNMDNFIVLLYPHNSGTRKRFTIEPRSIIAMMMRYPELYKLNKNVEENQATILAYHQKLFDLKIEYNSTVKQCIAGFEQILKDYSTKTNYMDVERLGIVFVHTKAVETAWLALTGTHDRLRLWKSTYYQKNDRSTEISQDWVRTTQQPQSYRGRKHSETAELLFDMGAMQVFYTPNEPELTEYFLLSQGKINHRHIMMFLMSSVKSGLDILKPYLDVMNDIKTEYERRIESHEHEEHVLANDPNINPEQFYSRLEFDYKKRWPQQFAINRTEMIKQLLISSNNFKKQHQQLLTFDE